MNWELDSTHGETLAPASDGDLVARDRRVLAGTINVDCDTLADYARGYGFDYDDRPNLIFTKALPRLLDLFQDLGVRATFFVIGRDLRDPDHRAVFHRALAEGHELANHTWSHPRQFARLRPDVREQEVRRTHDFVATHFGVTMRGFRAPCYDMDAEGIRLLERLGYEYDSSVHPSPVVWLFDVVVWVKSLFRHWESRPNCLLNGFGPTVPYFPSSSALWRRGGPRQVVELPTNVWPTLRVPFYGTWHLAFGESWFRRGLDRLVRSGVPLNYHLHAVELLGFREDQLDSRFVCHPGMQWSLSAKTRWVRQSITALAQGYRLVTTGELANEYADHRLGAQTSFSRSRLTSFSSSRLGTHLREAPLPSEACSTRAELPSTLVPKRELGNKLPSSEQDLPAESAHLPVVIG